MTDIERKEFLENCWFANFAYFNKDQLVNRFGTTLDKHAMRVIIGERNMLLVYDLGDGYGKELSTGMILPLIKTHDNKSNIKVGSLDALVVFNGTDSCVSERMQEREKQKSIYIRNQKMHLIIKKK